MCYASKKCNPNSNPRRDFSDRFAMADLPLPMLTCLRASYISYRVITKIQRVTFFEHSVCTLGQLSCFVTVLLYIVFWFYLIIQFSRILVLLLTQICNWSCPIPHWESLPVTSIRKPLAGFMKASFKGRGVEEGWKAEGMGAAKWSMPRGARNTRTALWPDPTSSISIWLSAKMLDAVQW